MQGINICLKRLKVKEKGILKEIIQIYKKTQKDEISMINISYIVFCYTRKQYLRADVLLCWTKM